MKTSVHQNDSLKHLHKPEELVDIISIIHIFVLCDKINTEKRQKLSQKKRIHSDLFIFSHFVHYLDKSGRLIGGILGEMLSKMTVLPTDNTPHSMTIRALELVVITTH